MTKTQIYIKFTAAPGLESGRKSSKHERERKKKTRREEEEDASVNELVRK